MKIGIFQDVHANLPAFKKGLDFFNEHRCSKIYHVGDLIGIGPYPKEVFKLAISTPELEFIMGNHDYWFAFGLPHPHPPWMSDEEVAHQNWTHNQLGHEHRRVFQDWQFVSELAFDNGLQITFQHYGLDETNKWFKPIVKNPQRNDLDQLFKGSKSSMIFYGHNHNPNDTIGNCRYVNLGSAGCFTKSKVRLGILDISNEGLKLEKFSIHYEDKGLMEEFERRKVPARKFIKQNFFSRE